MTKEEAIKHLHTYSSTNGSGLTTQDQHEEAKKMAIKSLETQPGWIPTSVRLPEDNEEVLFCDNEGERWLGWHYGFWKTERLDFDEDDVVAWMPLPKPWEGDANG